jgi:hypothetical protein
MTDNRYSLSNPEPFDQVVARHRAREAAIRRARWLILLAIWSIAFLIGTLIR